MDLTSEKLSKQKFKSGCHLSPEVKPKDKNFAATLGRQGTAMTLVIRLLILDNINVPF